MLTAVPIASTRIVHGKHTNSMRLANCITVATVMNGLFAVATARNSPTPPVLSLLYSMEVLLGERFSLGPIPTGDERVVIPIIGGTFKGPKLSGNVATVFCFRPPFVFICLQSANKASPPDMTATNTPRYAGTILSLGADWRLTDADGKIRPDARYNIRTDDGASIFVQTIGLPAGPGGPAILRGQFETATNGTYAWLNDAAAVGVLNRNGTTSVLIDMWQVSYQGCYRGDGVNECRVDS